MIKKIQFKKFLELIPKLDTVSFMGLTKILCVKIIDEEKEKDFSEILENMIDNFLKTGYKQRRDILKVMRYSVGDKEDGDTTEN